MQNGVSRSMFGTDGIRACVGTEPFTASSLERLGRAIALWAQEKYGAQPSLLLAHDTRISCNFVKAALKAGLLRFPLKIFDAYILPTPALVQLLSGDRTLDFGIVISASHNPYHDNGIKVVDGRLGKITEEDEARIVYFFDHDVESGYTMLGTEIVYNQASHDYQENIKSFFTPHFLSGKKIVVDCANGAAYDLAPRLFHAFGATVIALNNTPDGTNINKNCGALYPEGLQQAVVAYQADVGFSFDGDADRVIAANKQGHLKDGDDILALLLQNPRYADCPAMVGTIMSNQAFEYYVNHLQKVLLRSRVGDKYVLQMMSAHDVMLGGEPSGHIIVKDYLSTGDGIFVALLVCQTMQALDNWEMKTFEKFPQVLLNVAVHHRRDLTEPMIDAIIAQSRSQLPQGRLIVRYSGTEALLRIMVEDNSYERALLVGTDLSQRLKEVLS
jgi:phosphoglucosamine mutase